MVDFRTTYKKNANVGYFVLGHGGLDLSVEFLNSLDKTNIDIMELGVPYSDPIADGEIIASAALKSLQNGTDIHKIFKILSEVKTKKSLVFMVYYNLVFAYGLNKFVSEAKKVGIKGLIVPELSFEESAPLKKECDAAGIALITLISVTTPKMRIKKLVKNASGFIYLLATSGITGGKSDANLALAQKVNEIREFCDLPIFVGFGIKNNKDVKKMRNIADGVVVGTSIVKLFESENLTQILSGIDEIFKN